MLRTIANWTMLKVPSTKRYVIAQSIVEENGSTHIGGTPDVVKASVFASPKSLSFPILVALIKGAWEAAKVLPAPVLNTMWFPFLAALILGMLITISNLNEEKPSTTGWVIGMVIGLLNSLVVFGAIIGIPTKP